jgi:nucleoside-diphosphate-sugar epimerase
MRVMILGGTGLIGAALAERLTPRVTMSCASPGGAGMDTHRYCELLGIRGLAAPPSQH